MPKRIRTTVNLNTIDRQKIDELSTLFEKTASEIVIILLKIVLAHHTHFLAEQRCIQYQERDTTTEWKALFVTMDFRDYESFLDLRKFCKKTVSLLVSLAIANYLQKLLSKNNSDILLKNNVIIDYTILKKKSLRTICWKIYWNFPLKL